MAKRPCGSSFISRTLDTNITSPLDSLLAAFLESFDSPTSIDLSFDHLLDSQDSDAHRQAFIHRATSLGAALLEAGNRSARNRASAFNSVVWPLPPDLTIKVINAYVNL